MMVSAIRGAILIRMRDPQCSHSPQSVANDLVRPVLMVLFSVSCCAATIVIARALRDFIAVNASCAAHQVPSGYADASVCAQLGPQPGASIMANRRLLLKLIRAQRYTGASGRIAFDSATGDATAAEFAILNQRKQSTDGKQTPAILGNVGEHTRKHRPRLPQP